MSKKVNLSLIVLSALILSGCTSKTTSQQTPPPSADINQEQSEQSVSTSIRDLLGMGQSQKCTYSYTSTDENNQTITSEGTIYLAGEKLSQSIKITSTGDEAQNLNMRVISDEEYMYSWDESGKTPGMKMKMEKGIQEEAETSENQSVDLDKKIDMKCSPWIVDQKQFTVPTNIQFTDLSEMMKSLPKMPAVPQGE